MSIDSGRPLPPRQGPDLWRLPEVLEVHTRRRHFDPPRRMTAAGVDRQIRDAVEVEIRVSEPFEIRGLGPVLWVGDVPLTVAESDGNVYRFLATEPEALKQDAPISLAWNTAGAKRRETRYRYTSPE